MGPAIRIQVSGRLLLDKEVQEFKLAFIVRIGKKGRGMGSEEVGQAGNRKRNMKFDGW